MSWPWGLDVWEHRRQFDFGTDRVSWRVFLIDHSVVGGSGKEGVVEDGDVFAVVSSDTDGEAFFRAELKI